VWLRQSSEGDGVSGAKEYKIEDVKACYSIPQEMIDTLAKESANHRGTFFEHVERKLAWEIGKDLLSRGLITFEHPPMDAPIRVGQFGGKLPQYSLGFLKVLGADVT
jgi:hypothetical protein